MSNRIVEEYFNAGKCLIIAEVAQAHDGSLGMAHAFIDAIAKTGADAVKFQTHIAEQESTALDTWRVKFSYQDATRFDYWKRMEFTPEGWAGLKKHAEEKGLIFMSSPFSNAAVELLEGIGMEAWKIASGELSNLPMLERILATKKPILISSGMSQLEELDGLVGMVKEKEVPYAVMQCTSAYPTPPEKMGMNLLPYYKERYGGKVGLSDHSGTIYPGLAGAAIGMDVLELHAIFSKDMFGPDVVASITMDELRTLCEGIRFIEKMNAHPIDKDELSGTLQPLRNLFTKSIVAAADLPEGTVLSAENLGFKKPGTGMPASGYKELLGRKLRKAVPYNHFFTEEDLE